MLYPVYVLVVIQARYNNAISDQCNDVTVYYSTLKINPFVFEDESYGNRR